MGRRNENAPARLKSARRLRAEFGFLLAEFRCQRLAKIVSLEQGTDLNFRFLVMRVGPTLQPIDRFLPAN